MPPLSFETCGLLKVEEMGVYVFPYHAINSNGDEQFSYFFLSYLSYQKMYISLKGLIHCHM